YTLAVLGAVAASPGTLAVDDHPAGRYEVTITNLTRGQQFTPFLVATHGAGVKLFELGKPASAELAALAEEGNPAPLAAARSALAGTGQVVTGNGLTNPGASVKLVIEGGGGFGFLSVAAMLIPTNDGFVALDSVPLPRDHQALAVTAPAYDAGSERND